MSCEWIPLLEGIFAGAGALIFLWIILKYM